MKAYNGATIVDWKPKINSDPTPPPPPQYPEDKKREIMDRDKVWVSHSSHGFILGRIVDILENGALIQPLDSGIKPISTSFDLLYHSEEDDQKEFDDNCGLMYLNEATLLHNIRLRYMKNKIYTYVANILIAINPYDEVRNLYSSSMIKAYHGKSLGTLPPHVFAIADKAFRDMKVLKNSQSIIVSGESGAGKTESTKYILKYLCDNFGSGSGALEQKILNANPILEAFGNAKTTRNNNSSRFGKFIEIHFDSTCRVVGGYISHYLLERARVISQSSSERNYHIFYQLIAGSKNTHLFNDLHLDSPEKFRYLKKGCTSFFSNERQKESQKTYYDPMLDDWKDFQALDTDLKKLGMSEEVYRAIASVLHIGNISFEDDPDDNRGGCRVTEASSNSLLIVSSLMGLDPQDLNRALTARVMQATKGGGGGNKGTVIMVPLKVHEASSARDALGKALYSRLFDFIVSRINKSIPFEKSFTYIGVLDIAGFEYFTINSYEQFCINYCNEKLQQFFNQRILKDEQSLYAKEGLDVKTISFVDNQDCIDLIESRGTGILSLLDEESKLPKPSYQHFTASVHSAQGSHFRLALSRKSKLREHREIRDDDGFLIRHFAGAVCYQTASFIEKNNDALHGSLEALVAESQNPFIQSLFTTQSSSVKGKLTFISVGNKFKSQLEELMNKLRSTGTNFIRCIKPNGQMIAKNFDGSSVLSQLQCAGMTSVLELMQQGYPSRTLFSELYQMYSVYLPLELKRLSPRLFCKALFKALGLNDTDFKFGLTKVFFRPGKFAEFDELLKSDPEHLVSLIEKVKLWLLRNHWKKTQWATLSVIKLKNKIVFRRRALLVLQSNIRMFLAKKTFGPRIKGLTKLRKLEERLAQLLNVSNESQVPLDIQVLKTSIASSFQTLRHCSLDVIDSLVKDLERRVERELESFRLLIERERRAQESLLRLQEEMAAEALVREREEEKRRNAEEEKVLKSQMNRKNKKEKTNLLESSQIEEDLKAAVRMQDELNKENRLLQETIEQERRDHELALRLASESHSSIDELQVLSLKRSTLVSKQREALSSKKHDLSLWKYAQLRDTINTSCDIELLEACREEFYRRLKIYHNWKAANMKKNATFDENMRAPSSVLQEAARCLSTPSRNRESNTTTTTNNNNEQRYFRIPFVRPDAVSSYPTPKGSWYAHFDGKWIGRQMEIHPDRSPILLLAGKNDMQMCEFSLEETGLCRRRGAEILPQEFEREWIKYGGSDYVRSSSWKEK